jgi:hypothetical protein
MKGNDYRLLDQKLCALASSIEANLLLYVNPQNLDQQRQKFFEELANGNEYNPIFSYVSRNPLYSYFSISPTFETYRKELSALRQNLYDETLDLIFDKKIVDLFDRMELIRSAGTENFSNNSEKYYGKPTLKLISLAREILSKEIEPEETNVSFPQAEKMISDSLKKSKLKYKVVPRESSASLCSVNVRTKEIFLSPTAFFAESEIRRLIVHEIRGHIFRYENGLLQPYKLFARGLSKETLCTEEGIAVVLEEKEGINVDVQLREYAGRVLAVHYASRKNFYETFLEVAKFFPKEAAFTLAARAKRGTFRQDEPGAFTKDILYLKGKVVVKKFLKKNNIEDLYFGRYSVYDVPLVKDVSGLVKPKYLPVLK